MSENGIPATPAKQHPQAPSTAIGVLPTAAARSALRPLGAGQVDVYSGFWGSLLQVNRDCTIPHGFDQLRRVGTLNNLCLPTGAVAEYRASGDSGGAVLPFLDSDVYKWLEAAGWELGRQPDPALRSMADEAIEVVAAAQRPDGYINSFVSVRGQEPYSDLAWSHEFYCVGHLVQAAIAWYRALGDDRLLGIAVRAVDHIDREFGASGRPGIDGHPVIEMALAELTRVTGERRFLNLAARMLSLRGHGLLGDGRFGRAYWQDHEPVRAASEVAGHCVRQLYLDCGAVDVAVETGDEELLAAVQQRWRDMVRTRRYLTGGLGSRHKDEAFGDPYELPSDRAYAETCAAIASVMLAWRLLLATGEAGYADAMERATLNAVLSALSRSGTEFFYVNPLQRRSHRTFEADGHATRAPWQACACCPPNLMRLLSSFQQYVATADSTGVQLHQYLNADVAARVADADVVLSMRTDYPWDGRIRVHIVRTPDEPWTLSLRVPEWCDAALITVADGAPTKVGAGTVTHHRRWSPGDEVVLDLDLAVRVIEPDPRIDAVRGCVAFERGPLVYCVESVDLPDGVDLEEVRWDPTRPLGTEPRPDLGDKVVGLLVPASSEPAGSGGRSSEPAGSGSEPAAAATTLRAIPYYAWANRGAGGMRVWLPR